MTRTTKDMPITAIAGYFGGKRALAADIVELLGDHKLYVEPFCGSLSVLMRKTIVEHEIANDLHGSVILLARVIANEAWAVRLYRRLMGTCFSEDVLATAIAKIQREVPTSIPCSDDALDYAFHYFIASWVGRNGMSGLDRDDFSIAVRFTEGGGSGPLRFSNAIASIPPWHTRLKNVVILNRDAFSFLGGLEDSTTTAIYVDPPYIQAERSGRAKYRHDFTDPYQTKDRRTEPSLFGLGHGNMPETEPQNDHRRLAEILQNYRKARIVVSHYDCPWYRETYAGWRIIEKRVKKSLSNATKGSEGQNSEVMELLIVNRTE